METKASSEKKEVIISIDRPTVLIGEDLADGVTFVTSGTGDGVEDTGFTETGSSDADDITSFFFCEAAVLELPDEGGL